MADEHVAKVVADEVLKERIGIIAGVDLVLLEHLVGEIGTCLEGETLRLAEGVVTVEEDVLDLERQVSGPVLWQRLRLGRWRERG